MPHVMIDGEKPVEIHPITHNAETADRTVTLAFTEVHTILEAWKELSPARRSFMYGNDADAIEPAKIIIAEAVRAGSGAPILMLEELDPFFDGFSALYEYPLEELSSAMNDALDWGGVIDEEAL